MFDLFSLSLPHYVQKCSTAPRVVKTKPKYKCDRKTIRFRSAPHQKPTDSIIQVNAKSFRLGDTTRLLNNNNNNRLSDAKTYPAVTSFSILLLSTFIALGADILIARELLSVPLEQDEISFKTICSIL